MAETAPKAGGDLFRERMRLSGDLSGMAYEHLCGKLSRTWISGGEHYRLIGDEEYTQLGYPSDDPWGPLVIKRESDGQCFELDIYVDPMRLPRVGGPP